MLLQVAIRSSLANKERPAEFQQL